MNISTLAKTLGISIKDLRDAGQKKGIPGFNGRNTRVPYNSALEITKLLRPEKLEKLKNDDKIYIPSAIKVADLAESINKPKGLVAKTLLMNGVMATMNEKIDYDTASLVSEELGVTIFPESVGDFQDENKELDNVSQLIRTLEYDKPESEKVFATRSPVVTVMGHVDHGKTTLLDTIRKTNVAKGEAGAITQHIASYKTEYKGQNITFVDTPGHEAFTAMRARGSQLADFVILVVSAVEGVKPQTVEVIERSKLSKVPVIVAINKIDLPEADIEKTQTEVAGYGLVPEEWGGDTPYIPISAKTGKNIDKLLETVLLHAEVMDLKGEVDCPGQGIVIESNLDSKMGIITSVLIVKNELRVGDIIRAGEYVSKIRKMENSQGKTISQAGLSEPVMVIGLPEVVDIGEPIVVYKNLKQAQTDAGIEKNKRQNTRVTNFTAGNDSSGDTINVILKADVSGSLEALKESILKIPQEHARVVIKIDSVGKVTPGDLEFAKIMDATILAFHTQIDLKAEPLIEKLKVNVVQSDIIYEILEWVEEQILKHIKHEIRTIVLGQATVLATFKSDKPTIQIFGGEVIQGKIFDNKTLLVKREGEEIGKLEIQELQRNKNKVSEVNISQQFGVSAIGRVKIKAGDIIESVDEQVIR